MGTDQAEQSSIIVNGRLNIGWKWFDQLPMLIQITILLGCIAFWPAWIFWGTQKSLSDSEQAFVCTSGISYVMSTPREIMRASNISAGYFVISYNRMTDNRYFEHRCKLNGNRLVWSNSTSSRWMDSADDPIITFKLNGGHVQFSEKSPY